MNSYIDTHAHLADAQFDADREDILQRAWSLGLAMHIEIGEEEPQWSKARTLAHAHPDRVRWTAGFHPYYAAQADDQLPTRLAHSLADSLCVGLGEIGLDYFRPQAPRDLQCQVFERLVPLARQADKPLILHCREENPLSTQAQQDMYNVLAKHPGPAQHPAGVAHCFQGHPEWAMALVRLGYMIGVDAPITYPKAESLRHMIQGVPLDHLVVETDSPYLPPQSHRGKRNDPQHIPVILEELARLKKCPLDDVFTQTTFNARRLFRLV